MYHIYVFGDISKYSLENELQLFCTYIIQKLRHLKGRPPPPPMSPTCHQVGVPPPPPISDDVIFAQPPTCKIPSYEARHCSNLIHISASG